MIFTVNHRPEIAYQVDVNVSQYMEMAKMSVQEWEAHEGRRFFSISKGVSARLRHGAVRASGYLRMDSVGWALVSDVLKDLHTHRCHHRQSARVVDILVVAITGPKGRLQIGAWSPNGKLDRKSVLFIRANQGHDIRFIREERVAKMCNDLECLLDRIEDLWHVTREDNVDGILRNGLLPGGGKSSRNAVYLSSLSPWVDGFKGVTREYLSVFVRVDPVRLMSCVSPGTVMQTANGTILVRGSIPPRALVCIAVRRGGASTLLILWHCDVADQSPSSSGPACRVGHEKWGASNSGKRWVKKTEGARDRSSVASQSSGLRDSSSVAGQPPTSSTDNRGSSNPACVAPTLGPGGDNPSISALWGLSRCKTCSNEFVSGTVECLSCGSLQFYKMTNDEARALMKIHSAKVTADAESMRLDLEAKAKAEVEAAELLKDEMNRFRGQAYRQTHRSSVDNLLRQRVRKQHVHRWTWIGLTAEAKKYREEKGLAGYVVVSASAGRTSPWSPATPDIPVG